MGMAGLQPPARALERSTSGNPAALSVRIDKLFPTFLQPLTFGNVVRHQKTIMSGIRASFFNDELPIHTWTEAEIRFFRMETCRLG